MDTLIIQIKTQMQKALEILEQDFATIRAGKASPSLVENITINAYGGTQPLKVLELATIHAQDAHTLIISPFDKSIIHELEKGIVAANVGINPIIDGDILRINLPPLTEERRREFLKVIKHKAENGKIMIRQIRHEGMEETKKSAEKTSISEDEVERIEKEIQKVTDDYIGRIEKLSLEKEKELMTL